MHKKAIMFALARQILATGTYHVPLSFKGTGAPGNFLEDLHGVAPNNADIPDIAGNELKFHDIKKKPLITLFRQEGEPCGNSRRLLDAHGWISANGYRALHTTMNTLENTRGFRVEVQANGDLAVCYRDNPVAYWTHDLVLNCFIAKLRRLMLYHGVFSNKTRIVHYQTATYCEGISVDGLMSLFATGKMYLEYDTTFNPNGSERNRGTKFRIRLDDLPMLYTHREPVTPGVIQLAA